MTLIFPINKYALNLDDLENVQGFNETSYKDFVFGLKLNDKGIYERSLLSLENLRNVALFNDPAETNELYVFKYSNDGFYKREKLFENMKKGEIYGIMKTDDGYKTNPIKDIKADIDFQLLPDKLILDKNDNPEKLLNSGKMLLTLLGGFGLKIERIYNKFYLKCITDNLLGRERTKIPYTYHIRSMMNEHEVIDLRLEFPKFRMIIEGFGLSNDNDEIIKGIEINFKRNQDFIVEIKTVEDNNKIVKCILNEGYEFLIEKRGLNLNEIIVTENYLISRIQFFVL